MILLAITLALSVGIIGCTEPAQQEEEEEEEPEVIELKVSTTTPAEAPPGAALTAWAEKVEEETEGRVQLTIYYSSTLLEATEILPAVLAGVADVSDYWPTGTPGEAPLQEMFYLPFLGFPSPEVATAIIEEIFDSGVIPELNAELQGAKMLYPCMASESTSYIHHTTKMIETVEDLEGMKIIADGVMAPYFDSLGAVSHFVPFEDTYTALSTGMVEGHNGGFGWMFGSGVVELTPFHTDIGGIAMAGYAPIIMNPDSWNNLPSDIKTIFTDLAPFYYEQRIGAELGAQAGGLDYTQNVLQHEYYDFPPEETALMIAAAEEVHETVIAEVEAKGLPGQALYDEIQRLIGEYS